MPGCFAYPYFDGPFGPVERLTPDLGGPVLATFRFPALDFYFWATEPTPPERRAEIDCGLQPAGVSQRTSVTVR